MRNVITEYDTFWKTVGKFDIYTDDYDADEIAKYPDEAFTFLVKLSYRGIVSGCRREAIGTLGELLLASDKEHRTASVAVLERENHPILGVPFAEYGVEIYATPTEIEKIALDASPTLVFPTDVGEIIPDFSRMKLSLSCAFKEDGSKYVNVRFGGYSVRYYYNSKKWLKTKTEKELKEIFTSGKAKMIMSVLENPDIFTRATTKVTNKSGIGQSTPISLHVLLPDKQGWKLANNSKEVNNPETEPALMLRDEGYGTSFLVNNHRIYKIKSFRRRSETWEGTKTWVDDKWFDESATTRIIPSALEEIEVDEFTKKRIERAIKRKL